MSRRGGKALSQQQIQHVQLRNVSRDRELERETETERKRKKKEGWRERGVREHCDGSKSFK